LVKANDPFKHPTRAPFPWEKDKSATSPQGVNDFHNNSDADVGRDSLHHTLGYNAGQAAPGPTTHQRLNALETTDLYFATNTTNAQSIATGTPTSLTTGWVHNVTFPNSYFSSYSAGVWTFGQEGLYLFAVEITYAAAAAGERAVTIVQNSAFGANELVPRGNNVGPSRVVGCMCMGVFSATDTFQIQALQTSGAALAITAATRRLSVTVKRIANV
jgi:hypothetical protein